MELLMLATGGAVLFVGVMLFLVALTIAVPLWETYWLHPLWAYVVVPLGLPQITYWHLFALNLFVSILFILPRQGDYAKEEDKSKRTTAQVTLLFWVFVRPVMGYYLIRWALS